MSAATERLTEMLRAVGDSRRRLEGLARRLAGLAQQLGSLRKDSAGAGVSPGDSGEDELLFFEEDGPSGTGVIDDAELNFEALDIEGRERERG
ncbi:MAG TPA: hypothetical protein VFH73_16960 [Polyangia bacterium]|jgi:hypothetical protein|nr:hypothetical protein [Polyangia bacterium]